MTTPTITYAEIKEAMAEAGLPVSSGPGFASTDDALYTQVYIPNISYAAGVHPDPLNGHYGLAYPSVMPAAIAEAVAGAQYSATLAGTPLTGAHPVSVVWTLTEENKPSGATQSYAWTLGDGSTSTTSVPTITHSYTTAGTFTASCVPTINGTAEANVVATAPAVLT
jgi:PKD repeat protein